jgi:hypothetical protein
MKSDILSVRIPEKLRNMLIDDSDQKRYIVIRQCERHFNDIQ